MKDLHNWIYNYSNISCCTSEDKRQLVSLHQTTQLSCCLIFAYLNLYSNQWAQKNSTLPTNELLNLIIKHVNCQALHVSCLRLHGHCQVINTALFSLCFCSIFDHLQLNECVVSFRKRDFIPVINYRQKSLDPIRCHKTIHPPDSDVMNHHLQVIPNFSRYFMTCNSLSTRLASQQVTIWSLNAVTLWTGTCWWGKISVPGYGHGR